MSATVTDAASILIRTPRGEEFPLAAADVDILRTILGGPQRAMYSLDEVADMLGLSINTVRKWRSLGRLRVVKVGRSVRVPADEVERLRHARRRR